VVTLTGNGLGDARALKQADTGIAMEVKGSLFANEAADIVSTRFDLPNIIQSIAQSRLLFENYRKTIAYILSHLVPELLPVLMSFFFGMPLGLTALQVE
jgi:sodium/potassium-transporting ATPase subunit alpha